MVFQQFNLFPQYTALENVTLAERLLAQETPEFKRIKKQSLHVLMSMERSFWTEWGLLRG